MAADGSRVFGFHEETPSERKLAAELARRGVKFVREAPVRRYTVDFLLDSWLVVEVDGESHVPLFRRAQDMRRQREIESSGFVVIRVPARDLSDRKSTQRWVETILETLRRKTGMKAALESSRRKALISGQRAVRERRKLALSAIPVPCGGPASRGSRRASGSGESNEMKEYFGDDSCSFADLLDRLTWGSGEFKKEEDAGEDGETRRKRRKRRGK